MDHFPSLVAQRRARNAAQSSVSKFNTEEKVVQHLLDTKPAILCCGKEIWLDKVNIQEDIAGYVERFTRKGFGDRGERLEYLQSTLRQKWEDRPEQFLSIMGFLMSMENNPTDVNFKIELGSRVYSKLPDGDVETEADIKRREVEKEIKQELMEEVANHQGEIVYSSDSELSDWDTDEGGKDEERDEFQEASTKPAFSHVNEQSTREKIDPATRQVEWKHVSQAATESLKQNIRQIKTYQLNNQPVISSQLDFHLQFGKFWEWKKWSRQKHVPNCPKLHVLFEQDLIKEILWSFVKPCTLNSAVFTNNCCLKSKHIISTLTQSSLRSFINQYGHALTVVEQLQSFSRSILATSTEKSSTEILKFPKIIQAFAHGVATVLSGISDYVGSINHSRNGSVECSTLLQLHRRLREPLLVIGSLENIFMQCFGDFTFAVSPEVATSWIPSIKLISVLEMVLGMERKPEVWRIVLFLFCHCLRAFLDDFLSPLGTQYWPRTCIFKRNRNINVSDSNFWTAAVTVQPYEEALSQQNAIPLSCLEAIVPKMLMFLKVAEMLRQLEQNLGTITGELPDSKFIVHKFLQAILPSVISPDIFNQTAIATEIPLGDKPDFQKYFDFMNLSDRRVLGSFDSVLKLQNQSKRSSIESSTQPPCYYDYIQLSTYTRITEIPARGPKEILPLLLDDCLAPIFSKGAESLKNIFEEFKVRESILLFQEIILGAREDFAQSVLRLTQKQVSSRFTYEDSSQRDPQYQKLLNDCYPDGRENFDINFRLEPSSDIKCELLVNVKFPLNVLLTPEGVKKYLYVSQQLLRVRKSVWALNNLQLQDCKPAAGVSLNRMYLLRFSLLHFCSSLRSFFMLKVFSNDFVISGDYGDLNEVLLAHENYLQRIELRLLKIKFMDAIIIKKMINMSEAVQQLWDKGISLAIVIKLEECLKQCWYAVNDFCKGTTNPEYTELYYHLGPTPSYF